MTLTPTIWIIWAVFLAAFLGLMAYRATITRYEEDQLFLDEAVDTGEHSRQDEIVRTCDRIQPFILTTGIVTAALALYILATYVWAAWKTNH